MNQLHLNTQEWRITQNIHQWIDTAQPAAPLTAQFNRRRRVSACFQIPSSLELRRSHSPELRREKFTREELLSNGEKAEATSWQLSEMENSGKSQGRKSRRSLECTPDFRRTRGKMDVCSLSASFKPYRSDFSNQCSDQALAQRLKINSSKSVKATAVNINEGLDSLDPPETEPSAASWLLQQLLWWKQGANWGWNPGQKHSCGWGNCFFNVQAWRSTNCSGLLLNP